MWRLSAEGMDILDKLSVPLALPLVVVGGGEQRNSAESAQRSNSF